MPRAVEVDETRRHIRRTFHLWKLDPSEFEILWQEELEPGHRGLRLPGAIVRYLRNGVWQTVASYRFSTRAENLRQCYLLLDRLRIAEQHGVQYASLTSSKDLTVSDTEQAKKEELLDAYDILGVSPDDPIELVRDVFRRKSQYYHPDHPGGSEERFKRLKAAYDRICESRGVRA